MNKFEKVKSSNIDSVYYDPDTQDLHVQFKDGTVYHYLNVPVHKYTQFMTSKSKRKFLNENIHGKHNHRKKF